MDVAFFKNEPGIVPAAIRMWTRSPYSHCEIHFGGGICYSAHPETGVGWRFYDMEDPTIELVKVPRLADFGNVIYDFCMDEAGCKYDWRGIWFSEVFPFGLHSESKWFCSEICTAICQLAGLCRGAVPHRTSPGKLAKLLKR